MPMSASVKRQPNTPFSRKRNKLIAPEERDLDEVDLQVTTAKLHMMRLVRWLRFYDVHEALNRGRRELNGH